MSDITVLEAELRRGTRIYRAGSSAPNDPGMGDAYFEVEAPCGDPGGQARVYRCYDAAGGRYVALKLWHSYVYAHRAADARREADLLKKIHEDQVPGYQHVIGYIDAFVTAPIDMGIGAKQRAVTFALVMEYADGGSLKSVMAMGPASRSLAERIAADICDGLKAVHAAGWHNDLKPANVLRVGDRFQIGDLGIARVLDGKAYSRFPPAGSSYVAPERRLDDKVSREGDIYSFGIIFHELLTAKLPTEIREPNRPPRSELARGLTRRHRRVIASCLEWDTTKRPTAAALGSRLPAPSMSPQPTAVPSPAPSTAEATRNETASARTSSVRTYVGRPKGMRRFWVTGTVVSLASVVALIAVGLGVGSGNHTPPRRPAPTSTTESNPSTTEPHPSGATSAVSVLTPSLIVASTNTERASPSAAVDIGGTGFPDGIYGGGNGVTPPTNAVCGDVGVTGWCSSFTLNLQKKFDLLNASVGVLATSASDCDVELDTFEGRKNVSVAKFAGVEPPTPLSMSVVGVSQITFTWLSSDASNGTCLFGFGDPSVAPPTLPTRFYYLSSLPVTLNVPSFCECDFPDGYGEIKAKVYVTNSSLSSGLPIAGADMYRIRLMVASQPIGWSSAWSSMTGQPTLVTLPKANGHTYQVWTIPPNPPGQAQTLGGTTTWATHWSPSNPTLAVGQTYSDPGVKEGDLTFSVPQEIVPLGIVVLLPTGTVLGYTFKMPSTASDGNTF